MTGFWSRLFGRRTAADEWERDEEPPEVAREYEFEHESVDTRAAEGFVEEHLGVPPEHGRGDEDIPRD
jgi:hypothetical protein